MSFCFCLRCRPPLYNADAGALGNVVRTTVRVNLPVRCGICRRFRIAGRVTLCLVLLRDSQSQVYNPVWQLIIA